MTKDNARRLIRGRFFDFDGVVSKREELETRVRLINDGLLIIEHGKIAWFGEWLEGKKLIANHEVVTHYQDKIISPGFVDTHVHYPQAEMIAAYGEQLLEWLNTHTFPTEEKYSDWDYAYSRASFFISQLLRNGTTTALVFGSVHPESVDALFTAADSINMRIIAGKVMMDRNAPPSLCDTAESSYLDSKKLIEKWHEKNRLLYAVTPRFAPTSTPNQLAAAQRLKAEHPSTYLHTHLSENKDEIAWVKSLYPECKNYLDVYHQYNLTGCRSIFAHCIHLDEHEWGAWKIQTHPLHFALPQIYF